MEQPRTDTMMAEHRFWLKILDDHAHFVFYALSPNETGEIERARSFIARTGALQAPALFRRNAFDIAESADRTARDFYAYLLQLLALTMSAQINAQFSNSMLNHMLNETAEYLELINRFRCGKILSFPPIHHHLLWLYGSAEHAAAASDGLDRVEKGPILECRSHEEQFTSLYLKSVGLQGWMRTGLETFPALDLLEKQAEEEARTFRAFLEKLRDRRKEGALQGTLLPEMADHMAREESYYLIKMASVSESAGKP